MGMFDDITCEQPLPAEPKPPGTSFQTKDFDCDMDQYTITADGLLLKHGESVPFHGMLNFYTFTPDSMWFEYEAKFTDGRLVSIDALSIYRQAVGGPSEVFFPPPVRTT